MDGTLGIFFVAVNFLALFISFPLSYLVLLFYTPISRVASFVQPTPAHYRPTNQPARFAYSPHVLPLHLRSAETTAHTRLDYGSLPAAIHRPPWSRSSTSPTMMCVYNILPR